MKAIKFFVAAIAMTFALGANAQLSEGHFTANVNLGSIATKGGFGLGLGYRADVYTHDRKLISRLCELSRKCPSQFFSDRIEAAGAISYTVPNNCVRLRSPYSEACRKAQREKARKVGQIPPARMKKTI